jgi:DNA-binding transcriptional ArsR family regulator
MPPCSTADASPRAETSPGYGGRVTGDADIAALAGEFAEPARSRMLLALGDGRSLAASVLASEAGVAPSTASAHLGRLVEAGLLAVEPHGRHRYYRLAGPEVGRLLEALAGLAPAGPIRSLRDGSTAHAVRMGRLCYDHLAGRLGVAVMQALLDRGLLEGGDGRFDPELALADRLSAPGRDLDYRLTSRGHAELTAWGVDVDAVARRRRPLVRYCVDWSEQRHHLAGGLGAAIAARMLELRWVRRAERSRAVHLTHDGRAGLAASFAIDLAAA